MGIFEQGFDNSSFEVWWNTKPDNNVQRVTVGKRGWGIKGQPVEGGPGAGMPKTRCLCEPSIVTKHQHDNMINQNQAAYRHWPKQSHTTATCLEGLCCKACRWLTAKLEVKQI